MRIQNGTRFTAGRSIDILVPENNDFFTVAELHRIQTYLSRGGIAVGPSDCGFTIWGLPVAHAVTMIDALRRDDRTPLVLSVTGPPMALMMMDLTTVDMRLAGVGWPGSLTIVAKTRKDAKLPALRTTAREIGVLLRGRSGADPKQTTLGARVSRAALESRLVAGVGLPLISAAWYDPTGATIHDADAAIDLLRERVARGGLPRGPILAIKPRKCRFAFNIPSTVAEMTKTSSIIHRQGAEYDAGDIEVIARRPMPGEWDDAT